MKQSYSLARRLRVAILAVFLCGGVPASFAADNITVDGINYSVTTPSLTRAADSYCNGNVICR